MRRVVPVVLAWVALAGCSARDVAGGTEPSGSGTDSGGASAGASGDAQDTAVPPTGAPDSGSDTTSADGSDLATGSSSTGVDGVECPPPTAELGAVLQFVWPRTWTFVGDAGVSEATCHATAYDGELLVLDCIQDGAGADVKVVGIRGGGPIVGDALAAIVGMADLRVSMPYGMGFFPGYVVPRSSLRTASGELLVLSSIDNVGPGGALAVVDGSPNWAAPFTRALAAVDLGCEIVLARPDTFPPAWQPFALAVEGDSGEVLVFDGNQAAVEIDGLAYEVSARSARTPTRQCMKCPESETSFSIVRHPR